jgi:hypothetical protein
MMLHGTIGLLITEELSTNLRHLDLTHWSRFNQRVFQESLAPLPTFLHGLGVNHKLLTM